MIKCSLTSARVFHHCDVRMVELRHVGHHVVVGEGDSLGWARGAGGVRQDNDVVVDVSLLVLEIKIEV